MEGQHKANETVTTSCYFPFSIFHLQLAGWQMLLQPGQRGVHYLTQSWLGIDFVMPIAVQHHEFFWLTSACV